MSYLDGETYSGFDVELAREVCSRLGWEAKFISIKAENAYVELSSGNIDVAWGGLALAREDVNYEVTSPTSPTTSSSSPWPRAGPRACAASRTARWP